MAKSTLRTNLSGILKTKDTGFAETPRFYLKLTAKCMKEADRLVPLGASTSPKFNQEQCKYLADKLRLALRSAHSFFEPINTWYSNFASYEDRERSLEIFKLLFALGMEVETFIQGCSKEAWIQSAILLTNMSEHVSLLGFYLEFCTIVFSNRNTCGAIPVLTVAKVASIRDAEGKIVEEKSYLDQLRLYEDVNALIQSSKSRGADRQLATFLLEKLSLRLHPSVEPEFNQSMRPEISMSSLKKTQTLGKGAFGTVDKANWLGIEVARKTFYAPTAPDFEHEVKILEGLCHPNIVSLLWYTRDERKCYMIMELMDGDLYSLMQGRLEAFENGDHLFSISEAVHIMLQVAEGLFFLHEKKIVHLNLKSANILVKLLKAREVGVTYLPKYWQAKVADFVLSKSMDKTRMTYTDLTRNLGTTRWMAPEMIGVVNEMGEWQGEEVLKYPFKVDVYSFGMVCYEILTGNVPFATSLSSIEVKKKVLRGDRPQLPYQCPHRLRVLIEACWSSEPNSRPGFGDICTELRHLKCSHLMTSAWAKAPRCFSLKEIMRMTNKFSKEMYIGGFHTMVYKGVMVDTGEVVAVKRVLNAKNSKHGYANDEFRVQIELLPRLHHNNLVGYIGFCLEKGEGLLVFEYIPNGSLEKWLFEDTQKVNLTWPLRRKILLGVANGIHYLHSLSQPRIVHRDIKPSNILLDQNLEPKVEDFSLAYALRDDESNYETNKIAGTMGYLAPECYSGLFSQKVDVYSFGVLLYEIVSGRRNMDPNLREQISSSIWTKKLHSEGRIKELMDPTLGLRPDEEIEAFGIIKIAYLCLQKLPEDRPDMSIVVAMLQENLDAEILLRLSSFGSSSRASREDFEDAEISRVGLEHEKELKTSMALPQLASFGSSSRVSIEDFQGEAYNSHGENDAVSTFPSSSHYAQVRRSSSLFKFFYNFRVTFYILLEPLSNRLAFWTNRGRLLLGSLTEWVRVPTRNNGQQVPSQSMWRVESKDLKSGRFLGQGCSGIFYETTWSGLQNKDLLARKDIPGVSSVDFENEAVHLVELDHPNIVKNYCWTVDNRSCTLVMEYVKDDLYTVVQKRKETLWKMAPQVPKNLVIGINFPFKLVDAIPIMLQIAAGIEYLHHRGIAHGDLKPSNVLVDLEADPIVVKVADFGLIESKRMAILISKHAFCFRMIEWSAPEVFEDYFGSMSEELDYIWPPSLTGSEMNCTASASLSENPPEISMEKADTYSFALTCTYILGGEMWNASLSPSELRKQISRDGLRPVLPSECPKSLASLILSCWDRDPIRRPTFSVIRKKLQVIVKDLEEERPLLFEEQREEEAFQEQLEEGNMANDPGIVGPRVVVGLDFGTTFSGFAFAHITEPEKIFTNYDYPTSSELEKPYCKTLTASYYKKIGGEWQLKSWGYRARAEYEQDFMAMRKQRAIGPSYDPTQTSLGQCFTKFKLYLADKGMVSSSTSALPEGITVNVLITDYLREMGALIMTRLQGVYGPFLTMEAVQWCVTVPSIWSNAAKATMKRCMTAAGLVDGVNGSPHPLIMVLEPEAASYHCLKYEAMSEQFLRVGDKLLVADIGGGTADLVVQEVISVGESSYRVKEVTISSGGLCGGMYVDQRFFELLHRKIGPCFQECIFKYPNMYPRLLKSWELEKVSFGDGSDIAKTFEIFLPTKLAIEWENYDWRMGNPARDSYDELEFSYQEMQSIFDPVVGRNLELISDQLAQVGSVKVLVVVGGFAASPYLQECIKRRFSGSVSHIFSPPNPGSAICQGAVALALHPSFMDSRICKKTYGFPTMKPFEEGIDPPEFAQLYDGVRKCTNRFQIYVKKGNPIKVDDCSSGLFKHISDGQTLIELELYSSEESNPRYVVGDSVQKEGKLVIDTSGDMQLQKDRRFKVSIYFGQFPIEIKAEGLNFSARAQQFQLPVDPGF